MSDQQEIEENTLYVGLTRPPMYLGVTVTFLGLNGGVSLILFLLTHSFVVLPTFFGLMHAIGVVCCHFDPRIFDLLIGWMESRGKNFNSHYWGCSSYEPF